MGVLPAHFTRIKTKGWRKIVDTTVGIPRHLSLSTLNSTQDFLEAAIAVK
jgi:hypothetical protein